MDSRATPPPPERLHALDAVRGLALMAGIAFHATMSFLPSQVPLWIVMDTHRSATLGVVFFVLHTFRMTTFFLIAGFFAHMSLHRLGQSAFIRDRLKRILVPLVVGWPILFVSIAAVSIWGAIAMAGGHMPKGPAPTWPTFPAFPLTHLWFLYVLLLLYASALILRAVIGLVDRGGALSRAADRVVKMAVETGVAPLLLGAPLIAVFVTDPQWRMYFGITTPDSSFVPTLEAVAGFGAAFGFGWLLHRQTDLLKVWERRWAVNLASAVVFTGISLAIVGITPAIEAAPKAWTTMAYATAYAFSIWCWTFAVIGMALRFLSGFSPVRRYIADASYWLYLIHLPIIMALQVWMAPLNLPWELKYPVILIVGFVIMFASYQLLVRYSFVGWVLNGKRAPKAKRIVAAKTAAIPAMDTQ